MWTPTQRLIYNDAVLTDILDALDKLDIDDSIPSISVCEAADLLKLPSLSTNSSTAISDGNSAVIL